MFFEKNEDFFADKNGYKYEYLATLDTRSCLVCGNFDGKRFKSLQDAPKIPLHRNCRCVLLSIASIELGDDTRASKNGQIECKITYSDWLKQQSEDVKKDVLGSTRFKLFKNGDSVGSFVGSNKVLTLEELEKKVDYKKDCRSWFYNRSFCWCNGEKILC